MMAFIRPASKHRNNVILSSAKNLVFSCCYEILHGACPEPKDETLRFTQGDKAKGSG
jgi:hypothetical protein